MRSPFFKQKTAYEIRLSLVGSEMCIRDSLDTQGLHSLLLEGRIGSGLNDLILPIAL